jgi:hypothetical protein
LDFSEASFLKRSWLLKIGSHNHINPADYCVTIKILSKTSLSSFWPKSKLSLTSKWFIACSSHYRHSRELRKDSWSTSRKESREALCLTRFVWSSPSLFFWSLKVK